jgi:RimJ/RimL family protein N-acetyltransferase
MLKGERVTLRALREDDFEAWYWLTNSDLEVSLMGQGRWSPRSAETARKIWSNITTSSPDELVYFAVEAQDQLIGTIGIKDIDRRSQHGWLAIILDAARLGQGYGRDAIGALLRWAFEIHNLRRISLETWATNERALRCYRAVGFVEEGRMRELMWVEGGYVDVVQMGILRREWRERAGR